MQLAALESASLSPLVLPPDVVQWFEEQLEAARAAPVPLLPQGAVSTISRPQPPQPQPPPQQQLFSPSVRQKRKWQAGSPPYAGAAVEQPPASRSWAAVVSGAPGKPTATVAQRTPAVSRLPYWQQLQEQLQAEKQQSLGFRDHAMLAAAGTAASGSLVHHPPVATNGGGNGSMPAAAVSKSPLLQALQERAASEWAATQRLLHLAQ